MIAPRKIKFEAKKKRNENYEFRIFLKGNADARELDTKSCLQDMTAADAETAVRCTAEVFRKKILQETRNIWGLQRSSLLKNIWRIETEKTDTRPKTHPVISLTRMETAVWATAGRRAVRNIRIRISRTGGEAFTVCWM